MTFLQNKADGRIKLLFNDFVVRPDKCNFRCRYCLSEESPDWDMDEKSSDNRKNEKLLYSNESALGKRIDSVINAFDLIFEANILRISGGELFLIKNIEDFLEKQISYETIQVITNGYFLNRDKLEKIKKMGKCQLHISLDGHKYEQNRYRVRNTKEHDILIENLKCAVDLGFDIEIGSVLTNANMSTYDEFLEYLKSFGGKVKAYPFPIRGEIRKIFFPEQKDIEKFITIIDHYNYFKEALPPKAFMEEVVNLLVGNRTLRCRIPSAMIQLFDDGKLTPCPNSWTTEIGNVLKDNKDKIHNRMNTEKMYKLFLQNRPRLECCRSCLTSLDIMNLYFDDKISYEEITKIPLYSGNNTKLLLKSIKNIA